MTPLKKHPDLLLILRMARRDYRYYVADGLSIIRVLSVVPILIFAAYGQWTAAFVALVVGWGTDPLDGIAARRWGSLKSRHPNLDMDGITDIVIAFSASFVPVAYFALHDGLSVRSVTLGALYLLTVVSGTAMTMVMNKPMSVATRRLISFNMLFMHGLVQIVAVFMWFAYMAEGLAFSMITGGLICFFAAMFQRKKLRLWRQGRLA